MVKYGVNIWSYPRDLSLNAILEHASRTGYLGIELAIGQEDLDKVGTPEFNDKWRRVKELVDSYNLETPSIATGLFWRYNWVIDEHLEKAVKTVETEARVANILGAEVILVVPGIGVSELTYEEHLERTARSLKNASKIAIDYGIRIGLENVWNRVFAGPLEFKMLLERLEPEVFGAYFDVGNTLPHSLPEHWIRVLGKRMLQVHVKDFNMAELRFCIPLYGDVNWGQVRKALEDIGYNGYVLSEVPPCRGDPFKAAYDSYTSLKNIFG